MTDRKLYKPRKYSLGLDIGTSSVGWAVLDLDKKRIHDLGVRIFERPEDPQNGDSLAKPRRDARSARRRLKRRRQRLNHLKQFFIDQNILTKDRVEEVLDYKSDFNKLDVYGLRTKALTEELSPEELLKVLYQIAKRRGFKSNRKVVEESDKEGGRVTSALKANEKFLADNNYTTVGDALSRDEKFALHKRNKRDDYTNSFARDDFLCELEAIIKTQRNYALKNVPEQAINELIYGIDDGQVTNVSAIMYQRPFMTKELIEKMVGKCTFEDGEKRAPKASYSFEVFRLASDLSHLVFIPRDASKRQAKRDNLEIRLSPEQISKVIDVAKSQNNLTYKKVRSTAGISEDYVPKDVRGKKKEGDEFGEDNTFGGLKAYNDIRSALKDLPEVWAKIDNESVINQIAYILTTQKADEGIRAELDSLPLSDKAKEAIIKIKPTNFKAFGHLSIKALQKITPHILEGMTYDKACETAGYDFKKQSASLEQITNPVVKRAITQTLKVVRAIERKYGKPYFIKVETARDLAKNFKDRKAIENENKENQARNQSIIQTLNENGVVTPTGQQIIKVKLYREQNGVCLYSGKSIDFETMLRDDNAYQVDHIVPFSRSNNDGITNKTLVLTEENQKKGNQTPFEYFGADEKRWKEYVARVESTYQTREVKKGDKDAGANYKYNGYALKKKQNLLLQDYKNDSWNVRALNDTRYITRFIQNYLRQMVDFAEGKEKQRVIAPNGTTTAYLRKRWGLAKDRAEDVLHHAKDAAVVAAINQKIVYQANLFSKEQEMKLYLNNAKTIDEKRQILLQSTDENTGEITDEATFTQAQKDLAQAEYFKLRSNEETKNRFPAPWPDFSKEVMKRTLNTDIATLQNELRGLDNYDEDFRLSIKPIFVSRMPRRKATAQAHKETIRSPKVKDNDQRTVRMPLNKVKRKDVENSVLKESDKWLYDKLLERLDAHDNNPEKAFTEPVYKNDKKFDKNGKQLSPVSTIKVYSTQPSGFYINDGKAFVNNGSMIRLDVYQKPNKKGKIEHFFVPVYAHQVGKNKPTPTKILPAPKGFTDVDKTSIKVCSLYPNDYVRCYFGNKVMEGYYVKWNISSGVMSIISHYSPGKSKDKLREISPRSATLIERYDISVLGDNYRWL
ncbi:type II CRISPR RNA-guided endonuclease Cas9 [TM7 phylum sp. oral taxon 348]|nr:type II CRISPR RNA-guided endonuclease Cas9 [TM7 phylum sp. oral taxon 348]TWP28913.1 type II CRISPR RNA-guided endonuclease Cas9 [TM7 phylum sp. oral taxon 348]